MSKPYVKPELKVVTLSSQVIRMLTREGFIEVFWEELKAMRAVNEKVTHEEVFNRLNELYYKSFGTYRYSDYSSFKRRKNQ